MDEPGSQEAEALRGRLRRVMDLAVVPCVERSRAVVLTGGTASGVMALAGDSFHDRGALAVIGVAPRKKVTSVPGHPSHRMIRTLPWTSITAGSSLPRGRMGCRNRDAVRPGAGTCGRRPNWGRGPRERRSCRASGGVTVPGSRLAGRCTFRDRSQCGRVGAGVVATDSTSTLAPTQMYAAASSLG
jgi:hypothetical protein